MEVRTYRQTQIIVKKILSETGIRHFCQTVCKGTCCKSCDEYTEDESCKTVPLSCSLHLCTVFAGGQYREVRNAFLNAKVSFRNYLQGIIGKAYPYSSLINLVLKNTLIPTSIIDPLTKITKEQKSQLKNYLESIPAEKFVKPFELF